MEDLATQREKEPLPFSAAELTMNAIPDIYAKRLCWTLGGGALGMMELYERRRASEVFEMHVFRALDEYNERIMARRFRA